MDAEWLELAIALGFDGKQTRATRFDMRVARHSALVCVETGIGKERSGLDARERGGAVAHDGRLKRWNVDGSSHGAPFGSSFVSLGKLIHESKPWSTKKFEKGNYLTELTRDCAKMRIPHGGI